MTANELTPSIIHVSNFDRFTRLKWARFAKIHCIIKRSRVPHFIIFFSSIHIQGLDKLQSIRSSSLIIVGHWSHCNNLLLTVACTSQFAYFSDWSYKVIRVDDNVHGAWLLCWMLSTKPEKTWLSVIFTKLCILWKRYTHNSQAESVHYSIIYIIYRFKNL